MLKTEVAQILNIKPSDISNNTVRTGSADNGRPWVDFVGNSLARPPFLIPDRAAHIRKFGPLAECAAIQKALLEKYGEATFERHMQWQTLLLWTDDDPPDADKKNGKIADCLQRGGIAESKCKERDYLTALLRKRSDMAGFCVYEVTLHGGRLIAEMEAKLKNESDKERQQKVDEQRRKAEATKPSL